MEYSYNEAFVIIEQIERDFSVRGNFNEAQTRFHILDDLIKKVLNWEDHGIDVEVRSEAGFSDYCLGSPLRCVLEAKREGVYFEIPALDTNPGQVLNIPALLRGNKPLEAALEQVQSYCNSHGVPIGIVSNGYQFVAFLATRLDGVSPLNGKCLAFRSLSQIKENFSLFWNCFSYDGIVSNGLSSRLLDIESPPPSKLSRSIVGYPKFRSRVRIKANP